MIGQYLSQTNETCYSVLQKFKTLKSQIFHQLNTALEGSFFVSLLLFLVPPTTALIVIDLLSPILTDDTCGF
jgi:hypothetical protein